VADVVYVPLKAVEAIQHMTSIYKIRIYSQDFALGICAATPNPGLHRTHRRQPAADSSECT
jgi:hypothetical protein